MEGLLNARDLRIADEDFVVVMRIIKLGNSNMTPVEM